MIKELKIKDFEAHKNTHFKFQPGLNVIHGKSNNGKSSSLRALELAGYGVWAAGENKKAGINGPVRIGEKAAEVFVSSDDGEVFVRRGSKGINEWKIKGKDGIDLDLTNPGAGSIPEAQKILGLRTSEIAGQSIRFNWSDQRDKHFLIDEVEGKSSSPSFVAAVLDEVGGLSGCEDLVRKLASEKSSFEQKMKQSSESIESLNEDLKDFENLDEEINKLQKAERLLKKINNYEEKIKNIEEKIELKNKFTDKINKYKNLEKEIEQLKKDENKIIEAIKVCNKLEKVKDIENKYNKIFSLFKESEEALKKYDKYNFKDMIIKINHIEKIQKKYTDIIKTKNNLEKNESQIELVEKRIKKINIKKALKILIKTDKKINRLQKVQDKQKSINKIDSKIVDIKEKYIKFMKEFNLAKNDLDNILKDIEICPFCNQVLSKECKEEILMEI